MNELAERLPRRPGLQGISFTTSPRGKALPKKCIVLLGIDGDQDWAGLGRLKRDETYEIVGFAYVELPGATEAAAVKARDEAYALLAEIEDELRTVPHLKDGGPVITIEMKGHDLDQGFAEKDRWTQLHFRIRVHARI